MPLIRRSTRLPVALLLLALFAVPFLPAAARADQWACQRYKAELANLNNGASAAEALRNEIGRLQAYYRSLNCEGGKFLFFDTRPPQCGAVEQRIRALNAGYGSENGEVVSARRRQLTQAVATACGDQPPGTGLPGEQTARGGHQVICVKTCDGSYFPMSNLPEGRSGANDMCQALCPGTEAVAYSMPAGDDALKYAATVKGSRAYTALPNAFKFRTSFTPNCSCKREGQTWAQSLVKAESMLVRHKGDIFVTPMQAEALSRPKVRLTLVGRADRTAAEIAADAAQRSGTLSDGDAAGGSPAATGSAAPQNIRVIAPSMIPVPARTGAP
ncbi:DUF2865 domain-containing protein [Methylobacterium organophilum]|uniref:DUF2865 domain-containing protein n=1 Tax=Methylobacterium organophilum TaxID=410 RepID=A0ABQ4TDJ7_METOR|nr:DUF2865 domain-containing protein [Methylobacterium organophilum]UMY18393.1 DUF2865 domain-containing protein [Methylobacterium organophilum]GJE28985.1 hypothetical protein LKMONMHP_3860 [Methylobacterium organophilum]